MGRTSIQRLMSSGWEPTGSCRLMMAATTMSSGLHHTPGMLSHPYRAMHTFLTTLPSQPAQPQ